MKSSSPGYPEKYLSLPIFLMIIVITSLPQLTFGETGHAIVSSSQGKLGTIEFPTSGSAQAHHQFLQGIAALHSFWYEEAVDAFQRATTIDPNFVMGYWGEAMAHNHPIWNEENLNEARTALQAIPNDSSSTERERRYLHAVRTLFGEGNKLSRDRAYAAEMEQLSRAFPKDQEASCFYALSLLGLATHFNDQPKMQEKYRVQAGAITLAIARINPDHPCAAHYTIHAFDDPIHASLALPQARRYAQIAPGAHHAQHMPAHIFIQLGMWDEAAASNKAGWEHSKIWVAKENLPLSLQDYHSLYWLLYAYLQQGCYEEAKAVLSQKQQDMIQAQSQHQTQTHGYTRRVSRYYDKMVAAYIVETEQWDEAHKSWDVGSYQFGKKYALPAAYLRGLVQSLHSLHADAGTHLDHSEFESIFQKDIMKSRKSVVSRTWRLQLMALRAVIQGSHAESITLLDQAVKLEEQLPPPSGPPSLIKPTHELSGEVLLFMDKPAEAQRHFEQALVWHTNRARSLLGLARAAARSGEINTARIAYSTLLNIWHQADSDRPELHEAKQFLQQTTQTSK
ncbi:MAG: hypothetical protein GKS05_11665 [Nitrospirales bacterium]|nr:hypothetical protein [Nitrospirales bacterium]